MASFYFDMSVEIEYIGLRCPSNHSTRAGWREPMPKVVDAARQRADIRAAARQAFAERGFEKFKSSGIWYRGIGVNTE